VSGANAAAISTLNRRDATLWAAKLHPGDAVSVPGQGLRHLFVGVGTAELEGAGPLRKGDVARMVGGTDLTLTAAEDAEVLIWQFT
jgi:redox-sensitive bicupin YhaK (pirin superfamily)